MFRIMVTLWSNHSQIYTISNILCCLWHYTTGWPIRERHSVLIGVSRQIILHIHYCILSFLLCQINKSGYWYCGAQRWTSVYCSIPAEQVRVDYWYTGVKGVVTFCEFSKAILDKNIFFISEYKSYLSNQIKFILLILLQDMWDMWDILIISLNAVTSHCINTQPLTFIVYPLVKYDWS